MERSQECAPASLTGALVAAMPLRVTSAANADLVQAHDWYERRCARGVSCVTECLNTSQQNACRVQCSLFP
jgi:hypothetical protein